MEAMRSQGDTRMAGEHVGFDSASRELGVVVDVAIACMGLPAWALV